MNSAYETAVRLLIGHIKDGLCYSLPVPVLRDDGVIEDVFLLFTVNRSDCLPNRPTKCAMVNVDREDVCIVSDAFGFPDIAFVQGEFNMSPRFRQYETEACTIYDEVRDECARRVCEDVSKRYAWLVEQLTQSSLMPFVRALSPSLFAGK